jgi:hypothetical protein
MEELLLSEMHMADPLVLESSSFQDEIATEKLKRHKSPGTDQILAELIQAVCNTLCLKSTNLLMLFGIRKNCQSSERNLPIYKKGDKTDCGNYRKISLLSTSYNILSTILVSMETNKKNKNISDIHRGINEFRKRYQPRINIIKDENGNLLADPEKCFE